MEERKEGGFHLYLFSPLAIQIRLQFDQKRTSI